MLSVFAVSFLFGYLGYAIFRTNADSIVIYSTLDSSYLQAGTVQEKLLFVSSTNSDKYHFITCSGAKRIKPQNRIYFSSIQEAENRGYTPAKNCKELTLFQ